MIPRSKTRRLNHLGSALAVLVLAALALSPQPAAAQALFRWTRNVQGDARPVVLYADDITTWTEQGQRVFLLKGRVWVEQGLVNIHFQQGVAWVDEDVKQRTGVYQLDIYAEGQILLEEGPKSYRSERGFMQLNTRGEVKLKAAGGKVTQQSTPVDPLFLRGQAERSSQQAAPPPAVFPAGASGAVEALAPLLRDYPTRTPPDSGVTPAATWSPEAAMDPAPPIQLTAAQSFGDQPGAAPPFPGMTPQPAPADVLPTPKVLPVVPGSIPIGAARQISIRPRSSTQEIQARNYQLPTGETAVVISSGIILSVTSADVKIGVLDIEADRLVFWTRGDSQQALTDLRQAQGEKQRSLEFYLSGNVEIRTQGKKETRLLRADEVYYDVNRHVAVALQADLEIQEKGLLNPLHVQGQELHQLNADLYEILKADVHASELPYNPGLRLTADKATLESKTVIKKTIFGTSFFNRETGAVAPEPQRYFRASDVVLRLENVPIFYLPFIQGDAEDPLGPLQNIGLNYNRIFGFQLFTTFDVYDLIGTTRPPGTRWHLHVDYMSARGPALGTDYDFAGKDLFGVPNSYQGLIKAYGLSDSGRDILGGNRGQAAIVGNDPTVTVPINHPDFRGRFLSRLNLQELDNGFVVQGQISAISDRNFLEQFFAHEYQNDLNQETFLYVKQQEDNWAWTGLVEPRIRNWMTETERLPELQGHLIGESFFDLLTYNARASAGYLRLQPTDVPPFAYSPTDQRVNAGRFDLFQELSVPLSLGPVKLVPYATLDLAYYTQDLAGDDRGRAYVGGGLRGSMPLSRLYPDAQSEYFNVNGIFHKIVLSGNYYIAHSDTSFRQLPQFDRLNDDASDQALRDIRPEQQVLNPAHAAALTTSPLFDPQMYALRRLVFSRVDTLDSIEVLQADIRQRWQTKRGYPGQQHIVDWMTLELSGSYFPRSNRDNFGESLAFLEYDWTWNIGDRTALVSSGWIDPIDEGPRVFTFGTYVSRPDRTSLYVGYRQIDPLNSKSVLGSVSYTFSPKYAVTASTSYDFGVHQQVNSFMLTRVGTDLQLSLGFTYNSILNNFGVTFEILPNLVAGRLRQPGAAGPFSSALLGR